MSAKTLTPCQRAVLTILARNPFGRSAWVLGRPTCKALLRRGLIAGGWVGRGDGTPTMTITVLGLSALKEQDAKP